MDSQPVPVVIIDASGWQLLMTNSDVATTLVAVVSEDPLDWTEMMACWPRYKTSAVPEFASSLPVEPVDRETAIEAIGETDDWVVLDLVQKRFLSGPDFQEITRDACFAMSEDEEGNQREPLSVHLAPWWELSEQTTVETVETPRTGPIDIPFVDRDFLFGQPLIDFFADRLLETAASDEGRIALEADDDEDFRNKFYSLKVAMHRDWLMTPRDEIGGRIPRELLHGGIDWIDNLAGGQRIRFDFGRGSIVALPKQLAGYRNGPMGREQMAIYFDLCRELLNAGWSWCAARRDELEHPPQNLLPSPPLQGEPPSKSLPPSPLSRGEGPGERGSQNQSSPGVDEQADGNIKQQLASFLVEARDQWLNEPFEGGSPPAFILECSRRRVPRGAGVEIAGMSERQSEEHIIDCDCPICQMMADGLMGVGFAGIDGHHLELDDEFAFSMCETREQWEQQQSEWAEMNEKIERDMKERERKIAAGEIEEDEFDSAWSGGFTSDAMPGGENGDLQLAFLLAEIVGELQQAEADSSMIKQLNEHFTEFRESDADELRAATTKLSATLETIASEHPDLDLLPRISDFQSRLEARLRAPTPNDDWGDVPF